MPLRHAFIVSVFGLALSGLSSAQQTESHLPSWLQMSLELRGRLEDPTGPGTPAANDHPYYLHRLRWHSALSLPRGFRVAAEIQDSEAVGYDRKPLPGSLVDTVDLRQLYAEYIPREAPRWRFRAGRQALVYGETRLIGSSNWGNVGPAWDAVNVAWGKTGTHVEAFAASPVTPVPRGFDQPRRWTGLHGIYGVFETWVPNATTDVYVLWKRQGEAASHRPGGVSFATAGFRLVGALKRGFDYNTEIALQAGTDGGESVRAWAGHYAFGYAPGPKSPRFFAQCDYATGDGSPGDGTRRGFDQLYPTYKWGTADNFAWKNIIDPAVGLEWSWKRPLKTRVAAHRFWLADRRDALYACNNSVFVFNPSAHSAHAGDEIEARLEYMANSHLKFAGGTARLFAGSYLKESGKGSSYQTFFLMWTATL